MERLTKGKIVEIPVHDEYYVYAQVLHQSSFVYFDARYSTSVQDIRDIDMNKVLFIVCSSVTDAVRARRWKIRGKLPIDPKFNKLPKEFIQDAINPYKFSLYDCDTGEVTPATREECEGLERCAVWYDNHIEDRIYSHYSNTRCIWMRTIDEEIEFVNKQKEKYLQKLQQQQQETNKKKPK